ncbi:MAG: hypothetical protein ACI4J5_03990 [Oscillospiraceae bacterium]
MYDFNFKDFKFTPDEKTEELIRAAGESFAVSALTTAAMMALSQIIKNGILAPRSTKIEIDGNVPAEIFTIKGNDGPKAVYISSKKSRVNLLPAIAAAAVGLIVHFAVNQKEEDKDAPINV